MSLLNIPTVPRRSFPLASFKRSREGSEGASRGRSSADLPPISEKEVRDLRLPTLPSPLLRRCWGYHSSTSSSSSLSSLTHCSSLLPALAPWRRGSFSRYGHRVLESGDPVLRFRVCIVPPASCKLIAKLKTVGRAKKISERGKISVRKQLAASPLLLFRYKNSREALEAILFIIFLSFSHSKD